MKTRKIISKYSIFIIIVFSIFFCINISIPPACAMPAENVKVINDRAYFSNVNQLLLNAKKNIYMIMFSAYYYDRYPNSPTNVLLKDLVEAKRRGVDVRVVLEQSAHSSSPGAVQNGRVIEFLKQYGITYKLDSPYIRTHAKLLIVDGLYTVVGSTNWSYSAMEKNHETAVIIKSPQVANSYMEYFKQLAHMSIGAN